MTGYTLSTNFPLASPYQGTLLGGQAAFVTKINAAGLTLGYSTYLSGNFGSTGSGIAVDSSGNTHVTGTTISTNFPIVNPVQASHGGLGFNDDAFVTKFTTRRARDFCTPRTWAAAGTMTASASRWMAWATLM